MRVAFVPELVAADHLALYLPKRALAGPGEEAAGARARGGGGLTGRGSATNHGVPWTRHLALLGQANRRMAKQGGARALLTVTYAPTAAERERVFLARLEAAGPVYARFARLFPALVVLVSLVSLALAAAAFTGRPGERLGAGMAVIVLLVSVPAVVMAVPALRRRVVFGAGGEETLVVRREGVAWTPPAGRAVELPWAELAAVEERAGVLLFVPRRGIAVGVPRRAVDERAAARLREIARGHLGDGARI